MHVKSKLIYHILTSKQQEIHVLNRHVQQFILIDFILFQIEIWCTCIVWYWLLCLKRQVKTFTTVKTFGLKKLLQFDFILLMLQLFFSFSLIKCNHIPLLKNIIILFEIHYLWSKRALSHITLHYWWIWLVIVSHRAVGKHDNTCEMESKVLNLKIGRLKFCFD